MEKCIQKSSMSNKLSFYDNNNNSSVIEVKNELMQIQLVFNDYFRMKTRNIKLFILGISSLVRNF